MKYYPIKPGDDVQIVLLNPDAEFRLTVTEESVDKKISDGLHLRKKISGTAQLGNSCPICESERIESRFDILDL